MSAELLRPLVLLTLFVASTVSVHTEDHLLIDSAPPVKPVPVDVILKKTQSGQNQLHGSKPAFSHIDPQNSNGNPLNVIHTDINAAPFPSLTDLVGTHVSDNRVGDSPGAHGNIPDVGPPDVPPHGRTHIDLLGVHGNTAGVPVVHRVGPPDVPPHGRTHIDLLGVHGNTAGVPVVHRVGPPDIPPHGRTHIDLLGVHGNTAGVPVVHRVGPPDVPPHGRTHIDLLGVHGNTADVPVVHRVGPPDIPPHGRTHIDLLGVHGNTAGVPVVHRVGPPDVPPHGRTHIDLLGVHGNTAGVPVVHRVGPPDVPPHGRTHIDLLGVHGNTADVPVVHRVGPPDVPPHGRTHIDLLGVHGNTADVPVVHRVGPPDVPPHGRTHIDLLGVHGNTAGVPVVHREGPPDIHVLPKTGPGDLGIHGKVVGVTSERSRRPIILPASVVKNIQKTQLSSSSAKLPKISPVMSGTLKKENIKLPSHSVVDHSSPIPKKKIPSPKTGSVGRPILRPDVNRISISKTLHQMLRGIGMPAPLPVIPRIRTNSSPMQRGFVVPASQVERFQESQLGQLPTQRRRTSAVNIPKVRRGRLSRMLPHVPVVVASSFNSAIRPRRVGSSSQSLLDEVRKAASSVVRGILGLGSGGRQRYRNNNRRRRLNRRRGRVFVH